jgi:uncharacterized membrane protein YoaK (UPF0700 family)
MALTAIAGFADAHVFLFVTSVFIANMSGNLVLLGIALGDGEWVIAGRRVAAVAGFMLGIGATTLFNDRRRRSSRPLRPDLVMVVEAVLLTGLVLWVGTVGADRPAEAAIVVYPAVALGSFAMGMQNAALLRVGMVAVATTYASGSSARLGTEAALALSAPTRDEASPHRQVVRVMAALVVAYVAGAALAAALGPHLGWLLLAPAALLLLAAVRSRWSPGGDPADGDAGSPHPG